MTTNWKQLLEKRRVCLKKQYLHTDGNTPSGMAFKDGHASLEPLLLKAIEALEDIKGHSHWCSVCGASELADTAIEEIKAELEKA